MKQFRDLTTKEKKEYLAILLLLPFAYIGHLFRKANFRTFYKRGVAVCLALVMIAVIMPIMSIPANAIYTSAMTWYTANPIRPIDNNPNLGKNTYTVEIIFDSDGNVGSTVVGKNCDSCYFQVTFPTATTYSSVTSSGASSVKNCSPSGQTNHITYSKHLGKNFMTNGSDKMTITYTGVSALPFNIFLDLDPVGSARTYTGDVTIKVNGSIWYTKSDFGGKCSNTYTEYFFDDYPVPTGAAVNVSSTSVAAPVSGTTNIPYTVTAKTPRGADLGDGCLTGARVWLNEGQTSGTYISTDPVSWNCHGYVLSERLVQKNSTSAFSANGISLNSGGKAVTVDGAKINAAGQTYEFRIESKIVTGVDYINNIKYCGNAVTVYSPVITVKPQSKYTVKYNANGGSGSMANQSFYWSEAKNLTANAFTYTPKVTFNENGGNAVSDASVAATFGGWEDRSTTTYGGTTYKYTDFDAAGYAIRNNDVFVSSFCSSVYNKDGLLNHYVNHGKAEYANGSGSRAPNTGYIYAYPNGAKVSNLTTTANGTVNLYAKWKYGKTTLPTPTKAGYTFKGWKGDLMDIATLTNGMEISDTSRGTIGSNSGYAVTENLIPVVGGATYTSNYEVCGLYSFDANGNFIKRESSYATTHTVSSNAAFVRVEVNVTKGISFDQYQSGLTLTYTLSAGTSFPVGGNQTLTAQWQSSTYTITFDAQGGTTSLTTLPVIYGSNQNNKIDKATNPVRTDYTFIGWFTAPKGGEQVYQVSNGSCLACTYWSGAYDSAGSGATWKYASNATLYAQWSYSGVSTITFDAQGGTTTLKTLTATYGSNTNNRLDTTTNPTKEGYTFDGWFDSPTGGTQVYKVSNGSCIKGDYWTKAWESAGTGATWKGPKELTLYAHWIPKKYTVTWKNHDGSVLKTDTGVSYNTTPSYNGATPTREEDEDFTYTFKGWSPTVSAVTGDTVYTAEFTAVSKRVEPSYIIVIPTSVSAGESVTISASEVVLNTDETLTITLQTDFSLTNEQNAKLSFNINDGAVGNNAVVLSVAGNGDKNNPLSKNSEVLRFEVTEEAKYSGIYSGNITFNIAVNTAENN